jgi:cytochrome c peroxidase
VQVDTSEISGFTSPAGNDLPLGLDNVLAAQAMFPVTSSTEMAGQNGENDQANFSATGNFPALWDFIANKLQAVPEYVDLFSEAFLDVNTAEDITYVHAANAIAAFEAVVWRFDNAPFDVYLRGDNVALSKQQASGLKLFYGIAGCSTCHSGTYQTDQQFHAIAMPQIGPGKGDGDWGREDFGRERVTGNNDDHFKFRTPTLRNIALTAPYGHSGAFNSLETIVRHHLNAVTSLNDYDFSQAVLPSREDLDEVDDYVMSDPFLVGDLAARNELSPVSLSDDDVMDIVAFLYALTDPAALDLRNDTPKSLPSGSPLFD